jgi:uncharacterized protein DUF4431
MHRCHAIILLAALSIPASATAECLKSNVAGQVAQGRLTVERAHDAAGRPERPFILMLAASACLDADDPEDAVKSTRTIHVFPADEKMQPVFRRMVGKAVIVHGSPFAAMTAHHHAPIVMEVTAIDPL